MENLRSHGKRYSFLPEKLILITTNLQPYKKSGFTLIELMVAIAIIGILATIGYSTYSSIQANARDAKRKADVDAIAQALEDNYDAGSGTYLKTYNTNSATDLNSKAFTSGVVPTNGSQNYSFQLSQDKKAFVVCVNNLEKSTSSYCKYSANGSTASINSLSSTAPVTISPNIFYVVNKAPFVSPATYFTPSQVINSITITRGGDASSGTWAVCDSSYKIMGSPLIDNGTSDPVLSNLNLSPNRPYYLFWCKGRTTALTGATYCYNFIQPPNDCPVTGNYSFTQIKGTF